MNEDEKQRERERIEMRLDRLETIVLVILQDLIPREQLKAGLKPHSALALLGFVAQLRQENGLSVFEKPE